jgi:L-ornithine N5-oxygenase
MLLDGATMQVSFLKDLVTLRNPASRFGFISYLHTKDRLIDFINHKFLYPSRIEFHDYLSWCAAQVSHLVDYGRDVVSARPVRTDGMVTHYEVTALDTATKEPLVTLARNLVVAPGLAPRMPEGLTPSKRVWHSSTLLDSLATFDVVEPRRFVVLGAGQSAAEVVDHLHRSYPTAEICAVFSRFGYSQADDSPYANRIFDPRSVDFFHDAPDDVKTMMQQYHANTNYSVVDADLIKELYRRAYVEKIEGVARLRVINVSKMVSAREQADRVEVVIRRLNNGALITLAADVLVCATGYRPTDPRSMLGEVVPLLWTDEQGLLRVERDYRVATGPDVLGGVYLCGSTEHSHGITSSLLSMAAVRAGEILRSVVERAEGTSLAVNSGRVEEPAWRGTPRSED